MRFSSRPLLLLAAAGLASAGPFPRDDRHDLGFSYLMPRACDSYCGSDNQYCCGSGETCTTVSGVASCAGGYATTWTETHTYTTTIMTLWDAAPAATSGVSCTPQNTQQEACGTICCAGWQTCAYEGQCSAKSGMEDGTTVVITSDGKVTTQYSAPYRVTGTTTYTTEGVRTTASETGSGTSTATSGSDTIGAGGTGGNLSPGAIAGIVIGTIAGVALLLLLCFCCIARGLWLAIFGKKKKNDSSERVDVYEERYSRHGSRPGTAHSKRAKHKGWFGGGGPSSAASRRDEKRKSSGAKWLGLAGLAATLLALLNLKKDKRPASKPARSSRSSRSSSRYSDSYYTYSDYTDPSSRSSRSASRHTRRTARTARTAGTRDSRARSYYSHSVATSRRD